jgi:hypothetical protein
MMCMQIGNVRACAESQDLRSITYDEYRRRRSRRWRRRETGISLPNSAAQSDAATIFLLLAFAPDEQKGRYPLARSHRDSS